MSTFSLKSIYSFLEIRRCIFKAVVASAATTAVVVVQALLVMVAIVVATTLQFNKNKRKYSTSHLNPHSISALSPVEQIHTQCHATPC